MCTRGRGGEREGMKWVTGNRKNGDNLDKFGGGSGNDPVEQL